MKKDKYLEYKKKYNSKLEKKSKKSNTLALIRLISFVIFLLILIYGLFTNQTLVVFLSLVVLSIFLFFVIKHEEISKESNILKLSKEVCDEYVARFSDDWISFKDGANLDITDSDYALSDLDIMGDVSLFKYLNVTKTKGARNLLIKRLSNNNLSSNELENSQKSIKEISEKTEFSINLQANLKDFANQTFNKDIRQSIKTIDNVKGINKINIFFIINTLLSVLTITTMVLVIVDNSNIPLFLLSLITNLIFSILILLLNKEEFTKISNVTKSLSKLEQLYIVVKDETFKYKDLTTKQQNIIHGLDSIQYAKQISTLDSYKSNMLSYTLINAFFPLNALIIRKYNKFATVNKDKLLNSVEAFELFEVYISLAIIPQIKENTCLPTLSKEFRLDFKDLKHPLINEFKSVSNSYKTKDEVTIITGSNMSGKTSFLRTMGINLILMQAGTYVCASKFSAPYLKVFTSMRIKDDISKGISSFYAELLRIKEAINYQKTNKNMIMLIDEIFRGTNFNDRIDGAIAMIKKLNKENVMLFITTHDLKLCDVDITNKRNYHFSEKYEGDNIMFDYTLKEGRCLTTNAKYLMNLIGIN